MKEVLGAREALNNISTSQPAQAAKKVVQDVAASKPVQTAGKVVGVAMKARKIKGLYDEGRYRGAQAAAELKNATETAPAPAGMKNAHASLMLRKMADDKKGLEWRLVYNPLLAGAGLAAATALGHGAAAAAKGIGGMFERSRNEKLFQRLARKDKNLAKDPRARDYFNLIMTYAPSLGKNDIAVGDFLKKQLQYPVSGHEFLKSLADFESTVSKTDEGRMPQRVGLAFETGLATGPTSFYQGYATEKGKKWAK